MASKRTKMEEAVRTQNILVSKFSPRKRSCTFVSKISINQRLSLAFSYKYYDTKNRYISLVKEYTVGTGTWCRSAGGTGGWAR